MIYVSYVKNKNKKDAINISLVLLLCSFVVFFCCVLLLCSFVVFFCYVVVVCVFIERIQGVAC
jgi:hypothetical protein